LAELVRHFDPWFRSIQPGNSPIGNQVPWIVFSAFEYLEQRVRPGLRVLEFGVGGSTLYFLGRGCRLTSIEHDEKWNAAVSERLSGELRERWTPLQIPPDATPSDRYRSEQPGFEGLSFETYARAAERFADGSFDLVLVDGRVRAACVEHALPKLRPDGGVLMLDNAERPRYAAARRLADSACSTRLVFGGPGPMKAQMFWQTVAWELSQTPPQPS